MTMQLDADINGENLAVETEYPPQADPPGLVRTMARDAFDVEQILDEASARLQSRSKKFRSATADKRRSHGRVTRLAVRSRRSQRVAIFGIRPHLRSAALVVPLVICDGLALALATLLAFAVLRLIGPLPVRGIHRVMPALGTALLLGYAASGLYAVVGINPVVELRQLTRTNTLILLAILMATYVADAQPFWRVFFGALYVATIFLQPLLRGQTRSWCSRQRWWAQPAFVFGSPAAADVVAARLLDHPSSAVRPVALVTIGADYSSTPDEPSTRLPTIDLRHATRLARRTGISYGIVITDDDPAARLAAIANATALSLPHLLMINSTSETPALWADSRECAGMAALQVRNRLLLPWPRFIKRTTDLVLTLVGGLLISPLLLLIAIAVKLTSPGPVFYGHTRIGKNGKKFKAWKFRSMQKDADVVLKKYLADHPDLRAEWEQDHKLRNDPRVTRLGKLLRKTSLDELPQLWNVIRGHMSLVGPRPIVNEEMNRYSDVISQYTQVAPGITGLWQVSGRNNTSYIERIRFDDYYVRNWSPWLDINILSRTIRAIVSSRGAC